jgi:hypothetical protein
MVEVNLRQGINCPLVEVLDRLIGWQKVPLKYAVVVLCVADKKLLWKIRKARRFRGTKDRIKVVHTLVVVVTANEGGWIGTVPVAILGACIVVGADRAPNIACAGWGSVAQAITRIGTDVGDLSIGASRGAQVNGTGRRDWV